ncbi:hypothetical protein [Alteribacter aurantiacus]|uniref:hypothetical protein n=1 Tax=Alteribacter aurantiacus TaxID=254410 RepID=UPI0003F9A741|nr:hypothetical protein [Alteribacter aurantiacus]
MRTLFGLAAVVIFVAGAVSFFIWAVPGSDLSDSHETIEIEHVREMNEVLMGLLEDYEITGEIKVDYGHRQIAIQSEVMEDLADPTSVQEMIKRDAIAAIEERDLPFNGESFTIMLVDSDGRLVER